MNAFQLIGIIILIASVVVLGLFALCLLAANRMEGDDVYDDEDITR